MNMRARNRYRWFYLKRKTYYWFYWTLYRLRGW